jgi:hypothetical protein
MGTKSVVAVGFRVLVGFGLVTASCNGQGNGRSGQADADPAASLGGSLGTGGGTTSPAGGAGGAQTGGTTGAGGAATGGTGTVPGCCGVDRYCPTGYSCAGNVDQLLANMGRCEPTPIDGGCYNDSECPKDGLCRSAVTCACNAECFVANRPGTCQPAGEPCCQFTQDCADGQHCEGGDTYVKGRCLAPPSPGGNQCYSNGDCPGAGHFCYLATTCRCGSDCTERLGYCAVN